MAIIIFSLEIIMASFSLTARNSHITSTKRAYVYMCKVQNKVKVCSIQPTALWLIIITLFSIFRHLVKVVVGCAESWRWGWWRRSWAYSNPWQVLNKLFNFIYASSCKWVCRVLRVWYTQHTIGCHKSVYFDWYTGHITATTCAFFVISQYEHIGGRH